MNIREKLTSALAENGLQIRGSFTPESSDQLPTLGQHDNHLSLTLIGNVGSSIWPSFSTSAEYIDGLAHPLDRWSRRIGEQLATEFAGLAIYPFDGPPYWPFLTWTQRAEGLVASPLGLNLHPRHGLWHAYRFALLLPLSVDKPDDDERSPRETHFDCSNCIEQTCLQSCPVNAFDGKNYATDSCVKHLTSHSDAYCNTHGCLARHACPVGQDYAYTPQQARFHMQAFLKTCDSQA